MCEVVGLINLKVQRTSEFKPESSATEANVNKRQELGGSPGCMRKSGCRAQGQ